MLILSRKAGEKITIADNIIVEVVRVAGNRVILGIIAPADVRILRSELEKTEAPAPKFSEMNKAS
jgi:carbon storage regulator CsrA